MNICGIVAAVLMALQAPAAIDAVQVPLREGLTMVEAYRNASGDFEAITTVTSIDAVGVTVSVSSDEATDACGAAPSGRPRSSGLRTILHDDLERAHALKQEFTACVAKPERYPGSTAISVSASVLRELKAQGTTNLSATTSVAGMVPGVLTRIERGTVSLSVLVNDEPTVLHAVHARWQSKVGAREDRILDDVANPLVLRGTYNGSPFLEVVRLSYPTGPAAAAARIDRDLSTAGRTAVYGIYFDFGSDRLKDESDATLGQIAEVLRQHPSWQLAVEGHTDSIGGEEYNTALSIRRAAAVKQALVTRFRIAADRLRTSGQGASRPKDTNDTLEGRARNRRVELVKVG